MPFKTPITIREVVDAIHENQYLLPSIQREVVWDEGRIVRLFDSLLRGYPISSFLFWKVPNSAKHEFQFYELMHKYHERDYRHNPKANVDGLGDLNAILDGQQRLTSLYIGLRGTYSTRIPRRRRNDPTAYPKKELYLNLIAPIPENDQQEYGLLYAFEFLTDDEASKNDEKCFWFKVGNVLNFDQDKPAEIYKFLIQNGLGNNEFAAECLFRLHQVIHKEPNINYFEEQEPNLEKVLNIFVRINSGGVPLSHSDLLLSIATSQWQHRDARETIQDFTDELNNVGDGFDFSKDFVLKACLVLSNVDVAFRVKNFTKANMIRIEKEWDILASAIRTAVELIDSFGFNYETLLANNAVIPVAYYLKRIEADGSYISHSRWDKDRRVIRRWFTTALLRRLFSGQSDSVLRTIRTAMQGTLKGFPSKPGEAEFVKSRSLSMRFTKEDVEELLDQQYGRRTFLILSLLYPTLDYRNKFHQDHIFPRNSFTSSNKLTRLGVPRDEQSFFLEKFNCLPNLQLLEGPTNQEKRDQDVKEWLLRTYSDKGLRKDFIDKHYIPDDDLSFINFRKIFESRKEKLREALMKILVSS